MKLIESKTYQNLARAYVGETQAYVRYQFVEYGARNEGYNALAEIVDKVVYNEFNHARLLYTLIQQASKNQIDNIQINAGYPFKEKWNLTENFALAAEDHESEIKMYQSFEKTARSEGFEDVANTFKMLADVENSTRKFLTICTISSKTARSTKRIKQPHGVVRVADTKRPRKRHGTNVRFAKRNRVL